MKRKINEVEKKQDENWEWFKSFDRRVYLLHVQMAAQVDPETKDELVERYRFQLEVQRMYQESRNAFNEGGRVHRRIRRCRSRRDPDRCPDFIAEVMQVLREAWKALKKIIQDARDDHPARDEELRGEREPRRLHPRREDGARAAAELRQGRVDRQADDAASRSAAKCFRLHFKSVGGILALQEQVAAKWKAARTGRCRIGRDRAGCRRNRRT